MFIFSSGLFGYALYFLSPLYQPTYGTIIPAAGLQHSVEMALGLLFALSALPGVVAPFIRKARRERSLKFATFGIFISFLFLTILRTVVFGWLPVTWLPLLLISLSSAYLHVWLKVRKE